MAINGITFDNQTPTAKGMRGAFASALTDGILAGCNISYSGSTLSISSGLLNIAGGIVSLNGTETISISNTSGYARVRMTVDLSRTATTETFEQVYFDVDYAASVGGFSSLVQNEINVGNGTIYQAELCVLSLDANGITGVVRKAEASAKIQYGDTLPSDAPEGTIFLLKIN